MALAWRPAETHVERVYMALQNSRKNGWVIAAAVAVSACMVGCSDPVRDAKNFGDYLNLRNSLLDPSQVGRFDKANPWGPSKPVTWPILDNLDVVEVPNDHWTLASDPIPSDLVVEQKEYVLGEGDIIDVSVFELVAPGMEYERRTDINELGNITLQNLNQVHVAGLTPTQAEEKIGQLAVEKGYLLAKGPGSPGPQVSVQLVQSHARIFSILGQVGAPAEYNIIGTNFRLLDALALAHDITGAQQPGMDYLYVIRGQQNAGVIPPSPETQPAAGAGASNPLNALDKIGAPGTTAPTEPAPATAPATAPAGGAMAPDSDLPKLIRPLTHQVALLSDDPSSLAQADLDSAISGSSAPRAAAPGGSAATMPAAAATTAPASATGPSSGEALMNQTGGSRPGMIYVDGKWVEVNPTSKNNMSEAEAIAAATGVSVPRVIRIPIQKLKEGDPRYNVVIRPGDVINVPAVPSGEFYLLGHVGRPGVYDLSGRKVTLKQAIAASGGLDELAIPRRCDLIRRVGDTEVTVQVDLQRVFDGEQPDIYLKANDLVNVGTDMMAPFLAVTRNAYRAAYGFGFTYDRNFYNQPVIQQTTK